MRTYKAVYIRPDCSSYSIIFDLKGTRYETIKHAESLKKNIADAIVYIRTIQGEVIY